MSETPPGWEPARLAEIAEVRLGRQRSPSRAFGDHMRPYMRAANVTWDGICFDDVKEMDFTPAEYETYQLKSGDILLSEASGSASEVGKPAIWRDQVPGACFQNTLIRVRTTGALVPFLFWHFFNDAVSGRFASASKGVGIHHLSAGVLSDWQTRIPPLGEQTRIVEALDSYLSRLDAAVASLERVQAKLRMYRASVLKAAVEGRLVPTEAELARQEQRDYEPASVLLERILKERRRRWEEAELARLKKAGKAPKDDKWRAKYKEPVAPDTSGLPKLPVGWCWASVDQIGDVLLGRQRAPQYLTGKWSRPYLRVANIKDDRIDFGDIESMDFNGEHFLKYQLLPGDILVSEGQSPHLVGQSAIFSGSSIEGLCFQKTLHRFRALHEGPSPEFAQLVFRAHVRLGVFKAVAAITTNIAHLTLEKFKASRFPLPPPSEQVRIESEVSRLLTIAEAIHVQVSAEKVRIRRLRQSILKWAFEGKLVGQDPADEPAEKLLERIRAERATAAPAKNTRRRRTAEPRPSR